MRRMTEQAAYKLMQGAASVKAARPDTSSPDTGRPTGHLNTEEQSQTVVP